VGASKTGFLEDRCHRGDFVAGGGRVGTVGGGSACWRMHLEKPGRSKRRQFLPGTGGEGRATEKRRVNCQDERQRKVGLCHRRGLEIFCGGRGEESEDSLTAEKPFRHAGKIWRRSRNEKDKKVHRTWTRAGYGTLRKKGNLVVIVKGSPRGGDDRGSCRLWVANNLGGREKCRGLTTWAGNKILQPGIKSDSSKKGKT